MRKLRGDEIELQIAFQCAPLITGLKESNLLNIEKQAYHRMKDIFKESELTIYPLGIHAGKITVFLYHRERLEKFFSGESVLALLHEIGYIDTDLKQVLVYALCPDDGHLSLGEFVKNRCAVRCVKCIHNLLPCCLRISDSDIFVN